MSGLCLLTLLLAGCQSRVPRDAKGVPIDQYYHLPPPNNATVLSGGKITYFLPSSTNNPEDPNDRVMLKACRQIKGIGNAARSGDVVITFHSNVSGRAEKTAVSALVVGKQVLVQPFAVTRFMGIPELFRLTKDFSEFRFYPGIRGNLNQYVLLTPGNKSADVGGKKVVLQQPVIWVDDEKQQIMLLSDLLKLFKVSDAQTGNHSILRTKIIYKFPLGPVSTW